MFYISSNAQEFLYKLLMKILALLVGSTSTQTQQKWESLLWVTTKKLNLAFPQCDSPLSLHRIFTLQNSKRKFNFIKHLIVSRYLRVWRKLKRWLIMASLSTFKFFPKPSRLGQDGCLLTIGSIPFGSRVHSEFPGIQSHGDVPQILLVPLLDD